MLRSEPHNQTVRNRVALPDEVSALSSRPGVPAQAPKVVTFHGGKGGVGTSMLASELACVLARSGQLTVAIDADLERGALHYRMDVPVGSATFSMADVFPVWQDLSGDLLRNAATASPHGPHLMPSPVRRFAGPVPDAAVASSLVSALRAAFDRSVIDTRASMDQFTGGLLAASDLVVLVVTPELASLGSAKRALCSMDSLPGGRPEVSLLVNRSMGQHDVAAVRDIESYLGLRAAACLPEETVVCRRIGNECRPLSNERCALGRAVLQFAGTLI